MRDIVIYSSIYLYVWEFVGLFKFLNIYHWFAVFQRQLKQSLGVWCCSTFYVKNGACRNFNSPSSSLDLASDEAENLGIWNGDKTRNLNPIKMALSSNDVHSRPICFWTRLRRLSAANQPHTWTHTVTTRAFLHLYVTFSNLSWYIFAISYFLSIFFILK